MVSPRVVWPFLHPLYVLFFCIDLLCCRGRLVFPSWSLFVHPRQYDAIAAFVQGWSQIIMYFFTTPWATSRLISFFKSGERAELRQYFQPCISEQSCTVLRQLCTRGQPPIHKLVTGRDRRFRPMAAVLGSRGYWWSLFKGPPNEVFTCRSKIFFR